MYVKVNEVRLWFDVEGPGLVWDGSEHRRRPTVVLVHGGPGSFDHSYFNPDFGRLAEVAQVVYLDLRGHGRSTWGDAEEWSLVQCADDVRSFCDALGIDRPVVLGHSMGGPIVLLYAARHPGHAAGIIVLSGFARWDAERLAAGFTAVAGDEVGELARRDYAGEELTDEEGNRVYAAFGTHVPDERKRAASPQNLALNQSGMDVVRRTDILDQLGLDHLADTGLRRRARPGHAHRRVRGDRGGAARRAGPVGSDHRGGTLHLARLTPGILARGHRVRPYCLTRERGSPNYVVWRWCIDGPGKPSTAHSSNRIGRGI